MAKVCRNSRTGLFQSCTRKGGKPVRRKASGMRGIISQCVKKGDCGRGKHGAYVSTPRHASTGATANETGCYFYVGKGRNKIMRIKPSCRAKVAALQRESGMGGLRGRGPCRTAKGRFKKCGR